MQSMMLYESNLEPKGHMPEIERLTVTLPAEMAAVVKGAIDAGDYASTSEVIRAALRDWKLKRATQIEELAAAGRYPSDSYLPALARGFAAFERRDFAATIEALAPLAGQNERIGGSRAQHDLIEFTLLSAYLGARRLDEAKGLLSARRPGASGVPVAGIAAVQ